MNLTVYTCITGGYDGLEHLLGSHTDPRIQYVLFTDNKTLLKHLDQQRIPAGSRWEVRKSQWEHEDPVRTARFHKVNAHIVLPEASHSLWIDGALRIKPEADLWDLVDSLPEGYDIAAFKHPLRDCVYRELSACKRLRKDDPGTMQQQVTRYHNYGYPPNAGMVETACVVRRHTSAIATLNACWWTEIAAGSYRDQLSFNFVCWRAKIKYLGIQGCRDESPYFTFHKHPK